MIKNLFVAPVGRLDLKHVIPPRQRSNLPLKQLTDYQIPYRLILDSGDQD